MPEDIHESLPGRNGWTKQEINMLDREIEASNENGDSLRPAFERVAEATGRKPNSVRNFYYTTYRRERNDPPRRTFVTFDDDEIEQLLKYILSKQAKGVSVRKAAMDMADGDYSGMLRFQNKYRSLVKHRPELVRKVVQDLRNNGIDAPDPCEAEVTENTATADETELRRILEKLWMNTLTKLEKLPPAICLQLVKGISALADEALAADSSKLRRENERLERELASARERIAETNVQAGIDPNGGRISSRSITGEVSGFPGGNTVR